MTENHNQFFEEINLDFFKHFLESSPEDKMSSPEDKMSETLVWTPLIVHYEEWFLGCVFLFVYFVFVFCFLLLLFFFRFNFSMYQI